MGEKSFDKALRIKTMGLREWRNRAEEYNRYEATPYKALEVLFQHYRLDKSDSVVDFGCGRGRLLFYIHNRFQIPVTGIEANELTFREAIDNKARYRLRAKHIKAPIRIKYGQAESYRIMPADNVFYFFNPFSIKIFRKVVHNIVEQANSQQALDIILYYPLPQFKKHLTMHTPFKLINKIRVAKPQDKMEKFLIYRSSYFAQ